MIFFRADENLNALFITISGLQTRDKLSEQLPILIQTCDKLKDGFFIITDLSMLEVKDDKDYVIFNQVSKKIMDTFKIAHAIRIYGTKSVHKTKLEKIDQKLNFSHVHYAKSKNEALKIAGALKEK